MLLKSVELNTNDLTTTEQFYANTLALHLMHKTATSVSFLVGDSTLSFHLVKNSQPFYHLAFLIPANQMEEAFTWVSAKTSVLPFTSQTKIASFDNWNAKAFYFYDNHGNLLECIARYALRNDANTRFSASSLLNVNEVGIPVDNVSPFCEALHSNYGIPYFKQGPAFQDFTVMGEAEGLLIVTKAERGWLPTEQPAQKHPVSLTISLNGSNINLQR